MDIDETKKKFPHLAKEIDERKMNLRIDSVRTQTTEEEQKSLTNYVPDVVDYVRRCDTTKEALEIIDYLEKRGEVSFEQAVRLRAQLKTMGLRSFGSKKEAGHYEMHGKR
jgi:hypothetical protein